MTNTYCENGYCDSAPTENREQLNKIDNKVFFTGAYAVLALILLASIL